MTTVGSRGRVSMSLAVVAVLLTAGASFCFFDTAGDDHEAVGLDLCTAMLAVAIGSAPFVALGVVGHACEGLGWAATPAAVSILDPPPRR